MPRVARNYQREDFSDLLAQMRQSATEPASEKKQRETEKANHPMQVSQAKRRRDSLMSNRLMRYAYSSIENRIHDRDCAEVSKIPDSEFEMLTEYRADMKHCWLCGRRAIVRAGVSCEDAKHMDAYMNLLQRFGAITGDLYTLIIVNHAQLFQIKQDSVCIRCKDDTWMLRGEQTSLSLYHNNYEIQQNYDRIIKPTFHLQQTSQQPQAFRFLINAILHYSWPEHVARFQAEALAQKREHLRVCFQKIPNVFRQKRWSLLYCYYTAVDYEDSLCKYCAENGVHLKILSVESEQPGVLHCRVRRWEVKQFLNAAAKLKKRSIQATDESYIAACEKISAQVLPVFSGIL